MEPICTVIITSAALQSVQERVMHARASRIEYSLVIFAAIKRLIGKGWRSSGVRRFETISSWSKITLFNDVRVYKCVMVQ